MAEEYARDELLDLLPASDRAPAPLLPVTEVLMQLQALGQSPPDDAVVAEHLSMLNYAAASPPAGAPLARGPAGPRARLRRTPLLAGLARAAVAVVACAVLGTGTALAADGAAPGDFLYPLDRAAEAVGIDAGGAAERLAEAEALVARRDHDGAVALVEEAVEDLARNAGSDQAALALRNAAATLANIRSTSASGYRDTQPFRDQVAGLLAVIAAGLEDGSVDGARISEMARHFSETAREFAALRGDGVPPAGDPPGSEDAPGKSEGRRPETPPGRPNAP